MAAWSQLPDELWSFIGYKLDLVTDLCRFRSVCKSWRCSVSPFPQPPWLMLSEPPEIQYHEQPLVGLSDNNNSNEEDEEDKNCNGNRHTRFTRGFVGMDEQQVVCEIDLPEAHQIRCVGSTGNWLITVDKSGMISLLNPFSRTQIDLPPQSTFEYGYSEGEMIDMTPDEYRDCLVKKVVLSSAPSSQSSCNKNCIAMAIHHYKKKLAFARPGDTSWTTVDTPNNGPSPFEDVIIYKGQFYGVNLLGLVVVCDIVKGTPKVSVVMEKWLTFDNKQKKYLVEWLGELVLVIKFVQDKEGTKPPFLYKTEAFKLYILDLANKKWEELNDLGEYCLFLGHNTSISVLAGNYSRSLQKNCIYFTDDYTFGYRGTETAGGYDMGVFDLEDKSIQPHYKGISTCYHSPPLWILPSSPAK